MVDTAPHLWVLGPEVPQVHPGLFPFVLDYPEHAEARVGPGLGQGRQRLVVASGCQEREIRPCRCPNCGERVILRGRREPDVDDRLRIASTRGGGLRLLVAAMGWPPLPHWPAVTLPPRTPKPRRNPSGGAFQYTFVLTTNDAAIIKLSVRGQRITAIKTGDRREDSPPSTPRGLGG